MQVASAGITERDSNGTVILTAWKIIRDCGSHGAEAEARLHGVKVAVEWIKQPRCGRVGLCNTNPGPGKEP
jgi:hypothetical protein